MLAKWQNSYFKVIDEFWLDMVLMRRNDKRSYKCGLKMIKFDRMDMKETKMIEPLYEK